MNKEKNDLRALVIGFGSIGNRHVQNLLACGVSEITVLRRRASNSHFAVPESCSVVHELAEAIAGAPDFAIVCTPSSQHVSVALQLIESGIPCLIEKPLHGQLDDGVRELAKLSETTAAGRCSAMAYCMRYHKAYGGAAEQLANGRIGRCLYAKAWFEGYLPDWHPWEDYKSSYSARIDQGGGALRTLDHEIDFLNWTLGPAENSCGRVSNLGAIEIEADEIAHAISTHRGGTTSQITLAFCRKPSSRGFEFVGSEGVLRFDLASNCLNFDDLQGDSHLLASCDGSNIPVMYVDLLNDFMSQFTGDPSRPVRLASVASGLDSLQVISSIEQ